MVEIIQFPKMCCGQPVKWVEVYYRGYKSNVPRCRRDPDCNKLYETRDLVECVCEGRNHRPGCIDLALPTK